MTKLDEPGGNQLEPDDIRKLRGALSRAEFAQLVAVTPLTVYRWELPDGAPQARRPRGKVATRLAAIAARSDAAKPPAPPVAVERALTSDPLDPAEQSELLPLLDRLSLGELRAVESELLALMASGAIRSFAGRSLAAQALARVLLLAHADVCGALATVAPLLGELSQLPGAVELEMHVTAALVFSWPDGRFFDPGKANAHLAGSERLLARFGTPESRFLSAVVKISLALVQSEPDLMAGVITQAAELASALPSPVYRTLLREAEAIEAVQSGRIAAATRALEEIAQRGGVAVSRVRSLSQLAALAIEDGRPAREAIALIERARAIAVEARLAPGWHTVTLATVEGRALIRLARFDDAAKVLADAVDLATDIRWPPAYTAIGLTHVYFCTGDADALRALGEQLSGYDGSLARGATRAIGAALITVASLLANHDDRAAVVTRFDRQVEELVRDVPWPDLRGELILSAAMMTAHSGTVEQAQRGLRRAERHFERFLSIWATAVLRRSRGIVLGRQGRLHEARELVESALGTLSLAEDIGGAAHARLVLAQIDHALGVPGADQQADRYREQLEKLGFVLEATGGLHRHIELGGAPAPTHSLGALGSASAVEQLVSPVQRLAVRGLTPALIQREFVTVVAERLPGSVVCLEELDSTGRSTLLRRAGPEQPAISEWVELSDGAGRRLRLGVGGSGIGLQSRPLISVLASVVELALELATLRSAGSMASSTATALEVGDAPEIPGFISASAPMRQLKADLVRLSRSRATVIIGGESGSGKEVIARAIHDLSTRAAKPYVAFNCAAVPRDLFEGQLFGYRKGAFTGATMDQPGVLRAAEGGTVLLDEIGELPLEVQPKLLRFLENGEILPLGEKKPIQLDVRVIAATFRDLAQLVRERRFREDLYYRLQVVPLRVPPLRERPEDIVALAQHFVRQLSPAEHEPPVLAPDALAALNAYAWPGNVRELRNVIERSLAFEPLPPVLRAEHLRIGATGATIAARQDP